MAVKTCRGIMRYRESGSQVGGSVPDDHAASILREERLLPFGVTPCILIHKNECFERRTVSIFSV